MSEQSTDDQPATKKRPIVSIPFLIGVAILGIGGYYSGPWIMAQVFLQQEKAKVNAGPQAPETFAEVSQLAKSLQGNAGNESEAFSSIGSVESEGGAARERSLGRPASEDADAEATSDDSGNAEPAAEDTPPANRQRSISGADDTP